MQQHLFSFLYLYSLNLCKIHCYSFAIPHISPLPKGWSQFRRLPITVFGLINFATNYRALYPFPPVWPQTPNFTVSLMFHHFVNMFSRPNIARAPTLNETSDGSPKEYKNVLYMAWSCFLVLTDWFREVSHYYLMPGHSHDLQDQAWKTLKQGFYSTRNITWDKFVALLTRAFSTFKPEVITKLFVFDWETWLRPWMRKLKHHSKWRAFRFIRSPTDPASVLMTWKESESSPGDFKGSTEHPNGIEILLEIPFGSPSRIPQSQLNVDDFHEIERCFSELTAEEKLYWEELISEAELPNTTVPEVPDDYFNFQRFSFTNWEREHPQTFQEPTQHEPVLHSIEVDEATGISATGDRPIDLFVNDFVSIRMDQPDSFWLAKIRRVMDPIPHTEPPEPQYQVWFYVLCDPTADQWSYKNKWRAEKIKDNPQALGVFTINHFLTVKFTLTKTKHLRKETLKLIREVLRIDNNNNNNTNNNSNNNNNNNSNINNNNNNDNNNDNNDDNDDDNDDNNSNNDNNNNNNSDTEDDDINDDFTYSDHNNQDDGSDDTIPVDSPDLILHRTARTIPATSTSTPQHQPATNTVFPSTTTATTTTTTSRSRPVRHTNPPKRLSSFYRV
jgi:hypothetical protein